MQLTRNMVDGIPTWICRECSQAFSSVDPEALNRAAMAHVMGHWQEKELIEGAVAAESGEWLCPWCKGVKVFAPAGSTIAADPDAKRMKAEHLAECPNRPVAAPDTMTVQVFSCARCGEDHEITFERLINPPDEYDWWGMCANANQPVWSRQGGMPPFVEVEVARLEIDHATA